MTRVSNVALADHLASRREHLLAAWQAKVSADETLTSSEDLSRAEFRDHIPQVLAEFERSLRGEEADAGDDSTAHGAHRWEQGYDLREVILEWGHLHGCLLDELESARAGLPALPPTAFLDAVRSLAGLVNQAIVDSSEQFVGLQQKQAIAERNDLEGTVARFIEEGERRALLWRQSSHDLRGQLSIVHSATSLLEEPEEALRVEALAVLRKGTRSLMEMLASAMEDTRTGAIQEDRRLDTFDAAALLGSLCAAVQPLARERGLVLRSKGPERLPVEGDRSKVQRIAQNLLLNALAYTVHGGVTLSWQEDAPAHWCFRVQDTGPGLPSHEGAVATAGAGLGLSIVRRLGKLLEARVQVRSTPGAGTVFTVTFPVRYAA